MNIITNAPEEKFRLLVPASDLTSPEAPFVEICGTRWVLTEFARITDAPPFTCISYSRGSGIVDNMFEPGQWMSYRTIPAIEATIKASHAPEHWEKALMCTPRNALKEAAALSAALEASQAIWIDALCVPPQNPARAICLQRMGKIYSLAAQVFVVLSAPCSEPLHKIHNNICLTADELFVLENDDWITRAWTYQEMANSKSSLFIAQGDGNVLFLGHDFLATLTTDGAVYADTQRFKRTELAIRLPRLEALQVAMADHMMVDLTGRSAYQVMSAMHERFSERKADRVSAMIGLIEPLTSASLNAASLHPAEYFMQLCEAKDDYSFIYCTAPRSDIPGRGWRPVADQISPVLSKLLTSGGGQAGRQEKTHLRLDNMCRMKPGAVQSDALSAIRSFLQGDNTNGSPKDIADNILEHLRRYGFSGCGDYLELENGYFFPQSSFSHSDEIFAISSNDVQWTNGGPGMLLRSTGPDINSFCDVGVFVGRLLKTAESINVG